MQKLECEIACPQCGRKLKVRLEEMRPGRSRRCTGCGANIKFTGDDGSSVQRELDRLGRTIDRMNRRFRS